MSSGDIYVVYEKKQGWTVMIAEGKDISTHGNNYTEAIRRGKQEARKRKRDLVVNYKDGRTGRYYYKLKELL